RSGAAWRICNATTLRRKNCSTSYARIEIGKTNRRCLAARGAQRHERAREAASGWKPEDSMAATVSVKEMCNLMTQKRLLPSDEIRAAYQKWTGEAANPDDAEAFRRYLVTRGLATDYQASLLAHGRTEGYYIDEYKILNRAGQGRITDVYRAVTSRNEPVALK